MYNVNPENCLGKCQESGGGNQSQMSTSTHTFPYNELGNTNWKLEKIPRAMATECFLFKTTATKSGSCNLKSKVRGTSRLSSLLISELSIGRSYLKLLCFAVYCANPPLKTEKWALSCLCSSKHLQSVTGKPSLILYCWGIQSSSVIFACCVCMTEPVRDKQLVVTMLPVKIDSQP